MNAADQARSPELAQVLAAVIGRFRLYFPAARAHLSPWRDDPITRAYAEEETLDLAFHFPGWSPRTQCRSLLVQLRLVQAPHSPACRSRPRLIGVVMRGLTTESERWRLATVGDWQPSGSHLPKPEVVAQLQELCRELFALFSGADGRDDASDDGSGQRRAA